MIEMSLEDEVLNALLEVYISDSWPDPNTSFSMWHLDTSINCAFLYVSSDFTEQHRLLLADAARTVKKGIVLGIVVNDKYSSLSYCKK